MTDFDHVFHLLQIAAEGEPWHKQAKCRSMFTDGSGPRNFFFPGRSDDPNVPGGGRTEEAMARKVCATCPVRAEDLGGTGECLEAGIYDLHGFWGGKSPKQRQKIRWAREMPRRTNTSTDNAIYLRELRARRKAEAEAAAAQWGESA